MQKLIDRPENPCLQPAWQAGGHRPLEELVDRNAQSHMTETEMQFYRGSGRVREYQVMGSHKGLTDWHVLLVARFHKNVAGGCKILLDNSQIQIQRRLAEKRGSVVASREQRALQRYRRNSLNRQKVQHEFQVVKHPLVAYPILNQNPVAPNAFRR